MNNLPIKVTENVTNGLLEVQLTEGDYAGIIFTYGKVDLVEEEDAAKLSFQYDIVDLNDIVIKNIKDFETYIGKILEDLIRFGIQENSITYTGGVDENRTKDSSESDL